MLTTLLEAVASSGFLPSFGQIVLGLLVLAITAVLYILFVPDGPNVPPRFHFWRDSLSGKYNFKEAGPVNMLLAGHAKHGEIFRLRMGPKRVTILMSNDAHAVMFEASDEEAAAAPLYKFTVPVFGKGIVFDAPIKIMTQQLKMLSKGLMATSLKAHTGKIIAEAEDFFSKWPDSGTIDLFHALSELTILTASRCLLGREVREGVHTEFANYYQELSDGMSHVSIVWPGAPTTAHRKRDYARKQIVTIFSKIIRNRRATNNATGEDDFLQVLIDSRYKDGRQLSEDEICGMLLAGLFAGQHTSNITSTWAGFLILRDKEKYLPRILAEQKLVLERHGELTMEALGDMELLDHCLKETLRMYSPLVGLLRQVQVPLKFKQYTIPKGDIIAVMPPASMRLPELFKDPLTFDPDRFAPPRSEDEAHKWAHVAFGGGRHACLGRRFAMLQIKTLWSVLFRQFDIDLISAHPKPNYSAIVVGPTPPCEVRFRRRVPRGSAAPASSTVPAAEAASAT